MYAYLKKLISESYPGPVKENSMKKNLIVILSVFALALATSACGTQTPASTSTAVTSPTSTPTAPSQIADSDVSVCWTNGYAEMKLDDNAVLIPNDGFHYTSDVPNGVLMSRENISVTVDSVEVEFVASGVGDSLDLVVKYTSAGNESSFKLGNTGQCLSLSNASGI